jgi:nucleotide-binding universal stress UspA family protein
MFKRILIPTDGSKVARKAIGAGVTLAKQLGAGIVGYYAAPTLRTIYYAEGEEVPPVSIKALEKASQERGRKHLEEIVKAAKAAGVSCETAMTRPEAPHLGIIDAARKKKCDVIFMASHGHGGLASLLLGSVTQKVLAHSKIPVLVYR